GEVIACWDRGDTSQPDLDHAGRTVAEDDRPAGARSLRLSDVAEAGEVMRKIRKRVAVGTWFSLPEEETPAANAVSPLWCFANSRECGKIMRVHQLTYWAGLGGLALGVLALTTGDVSAQPPGRGPGSRAEADPVAKAKAEVKKAEEALEKAKAALKAAE